MTSFYNGSRSSFRISKLLFILRDITLVVNITTVLLDNITDIHRVIISTRLMCIDGYVTRVCKSSGDLNDLWEFQAGLSYTLRNILLDLTGELGHRRGPVNSRLMGLYRALRSNLATQIGATCGAFKVPSVKKDYREIIGGIIFRPRPDRERKSESDSYASGLCRSMSSNRIPDCQGRASSSVLRSIVPTNDREILKDYITVQLATQRVVTWDSEKQKDTRDTNIENEEVEEEEEDKKRKKKEEDETRKKKK
ncbi:hypothetical protein V1478_006957 [Vespula squamosa]|uniref:Uncharacterized protein n=1 Tax=Vespula squamosa TaxID=30214 RepID=A0ABD2B1U7_VESSQ